MARVFRAQARRWRIGAAMVRGARVRVAEREAEAYKRLYDEAEASNTAALKKLVEIGRMVDDFL